MKALFLSIVVLLSANFSYAEDTQAVDMMAFCTKDQVPANLETYIPPTTGFNAYIISIHTNFIDMYMNGGKSVEFRKSFPCDPVTDVIFYDSQAREIVATGKVVQGLKGAPGKVIDATVDKSGVNKADLWWYYQTTTVAYATEVKFQLLPKKLTWSEITAIDPTFTAPQGYSYLKKYPALEAELKKQLGL
jgi:predicted transcriptional regulator